MPSIKLGDLIELTDERNTNLRFGPNELKGISISKTLMPTKAETGNLDLRNYKIVRHNDFCYSLVTSRNGEKISIAFNDGNDCLVSSVNPIFRVKNEALLLPRYLMMFFNRAEFDRYARFNSWGSARETFSWEDMCDIDFELPPLDVQRKYVAVYESLLANVRSYEDKLSDLRLACDACLEETMRDFPSTLEGCLFECGEKNSDGQAKLEMGITVTKTFIPTLAKSSNVLNQKKVQPEQFAFVPDTSRRGDKIAISFNQSNDCYAVSSIYEVGEAAPNVNAKYLYIWFTRPSFDRFARFNSWGSVRETISVEEISRYKIGLPPKKRQDAIVQIFEAYEKRRSFIECLKATIKNICPILIRGAISESMEEH